MMIREWQSDTRDMLAALAIDRQRQLAQRESELRLHVIAECVRLSIAFDIGWLSGQVHGSEYGHAADSRIAVCRSLLRQLEGNT